MSSYSTNLGTFHTTQLHVTSGTCFLAAWMATAGGPHMAAAQTYLDPSTTQTLRSQPFPLPPNRSQRNSVAPSSCTVHVTHPPRRRDRIPTRDAHAMACGRCVSQGASSAKPRGTVQLLGPKITWDLVSKVKSAGK